MAIWTKTFTMTEALTIICQYLVDNKFQGKNGDISAEMLDDGDVEVTFKEDDDVKPELSN